MSGQKGIEMVTKAGGRDLIFGIFKDDAENLTPKTAEAAMVALKKLAHLDMNSQKMVEDGVVDATMSTLEIQCEQNEETQPKVVGVAAALLQSVANDGATVNQIVAKRTWKTLFKISSSSPDYLADPDCKQSFGNLIETCANGDDLRGNIRELGAVDLVMMAMNLNPNKE